MAQTRNFTILERNAQEQVREFEPGTIEYTYVASAVNIALSILSMPHARQCLADLAIEFDKTQREAWYPRLHGVIENPASLVDSFLTKVRDNTPMMVVDHTITHIDILAYHPRGQWDQEFIPRKQAVNLNARRIQDMVDAGEGGSAQNFRIFQFQLAHTLVHEMGGHLLITYLGRGRPFTPQTIGHGLYGQQGEAGRALELRMFSGFFEYYRDPKQDHHQPGVPHLLKTNGMARKISQSTIDDCVGYRISFPYALTGKEVHMTSMQSLGAAAAVQDVGPGPHFMSQSLSLAYKVRLADVRRVPFEPNIRLRAVA